MTWTDLTSSIQGVPPAPRDGHGFAALEGKVYIFGGKGSNSFYGISTGFLECSGEIIASNRRSCCAFIFLDDAAL
jgi:hypothetical protein